MDTMDKLTDIQIKEIRVKLGLSQEDLAKKIGVSRNTIINYEKGGVIPDSKKELLNSILMGNGSMLNEDKPKYNEAVFIENPNIMMIPVVSQYAYAGYTHGYADTEYIEALPKMPFFANHEAKGNYMGFEVKGDSMNNGSESSIIEGDTLACREIKSDLWQYRLHLNKWFFVIIHKTEGILVKKIIDHNTETGIIKIHSLNPFYEDREIDLNNVGQLFNVVQILRTPRM